MMGMNWRATRRLCSLIKPNSVKRAVAGQTAACWWKKSGTRKTSENQQEETVPYYWRTSGKNVSWLEFQVKSKWTCCSWFFFSCRIWIGGTLCSSSFSISYLNWNDFCVRASTNSPHMLDRRSGIHNRWTRKCHILFSLFNFSVSAMCSP